MQKKLLTLAVAGALAAPGVALAQVEVYGFISVAVNKFKYSSAENPATGVTNPSVSKWDVSSHGSNYGIRGRESLGGGQTAWFQIEQNAPMERSNNIAITPASRNTAVGLQGSWGNFFIGQWTTPWADLESLWSIGSVGGYSPSLSIMGRRETSGAAPNWNCVNGHTSGVLLGPGASAPPAGGICDAVESTGGPGHPFWRRISNAVFYYTPVFSGFQGKFAYQTNEGKATGGAAFTAVDPSMWSASVQWSGMGGKARVGFAYDAHKDFTTVGQTDNGWTIKGGFDFGFVDVGLAYEQNTYKCGSDPLVSSCPAVLSGGDFKTKQYGVAAAIPVGQGAIRASYSVATDPETAIGDLNQGAKEVTIGYDIRLSKRTQVGFGYAKITNDNGGTVDAAGIGPVAHAGGVFTWTGAPPNHGGASNTPSPGSDPETFFVSVIHRF